MENENQNPGQISARPAEIPEKFWDEKNNCVRIDDVLKSYLALEKNWVAVCIK